MDDEAGVVREVETLVSCANDCENAGPYRVLTPENTDVEKYICSRCGQEMKRLRGPS